MGCEFLSHLSRPNFMASLVKEDYNMEICMTCKKIKVLWLFGFVLQVGELYLKAEGVPITSEGVSQNY